MEVKVKVEVGVLVTVGVKVKVEVKPPGLVLVGVAEGVTVGVLVGEEVGVVVAVLAKVAVGVLLLPEGIFGVTGTEMLRVQLRVIPKSRMRTAEPNFN